MKLVMFGTGDFALPTFLALLDAGHDVRALVTQPDRPQGR
jgi:methionyl-tRNA formyltransferase